MSLEDLRIRIFCEGISDQRFLRDFLNIHYDIEISDKQLDKYIEKMGSWNKLKIYKEKITETYSNYTSLIFLDADNEKTTEKPGFKASKKYIDDLMKSWNWTKYNTFIFPNNKDEGTIENLLENIINPENKQIFECWENYENCLSTNKLFEIPAIKSKIYTYLECLNQKDNCSDSKRDFQNDNLWQVKNKKNTYILNLKSFLDTYLMNN